MSDDDRGDWLLEIRRDRRTGMEAMLEDENRWLRKTLNEQTQAPREAELKQDNARLREALQEIVEVDPETQIGGVSSYLYAWEQCHTIARAALERI